MTVDVHLSQLLSRTIIDQRGQAVGKLSDVILRLRGDAYPIVIGLVAKVGRLEVFLPIDSIVALDEDPVRLERQKVDIRRFERREGEVLLRADVLGHRLIRVEDARLMRAWDVNLRKDGDDWVVTSLDTRRPRRFGAKAKAPHVTEDWKAFEPLIGHLASAGPRARFRRVQRLKPAQIADLLEEASQAERSEILDAVHTNPELEADVFEELDADIQSRLFADRSDRDVAEVLTRMRADDAADAIAELSQPRRQVVLDLLPIGQRTKVLTLLGFNPASAGGLMGVDYLVLPASSTVREAISTVSQSRTLQPEALTSVYVADDRGQLIGAVRLTDLLHAAGEDRLESVAEGEPVRVLPTTDIVDVALLMSDYNLVTIPVVDESHHLVGIVTVDDVLEATIPADWRRREPNPHPDPRPSQPSIDISTADARPGPDTDG
ncbi:MAG: MgtE intracellular domain-contain protein [Acidimicrobiaceae bacterium]|nr:MgtE intracellular domain-contain protein [Acidimicrobiaceae bacterium]